MYISEIPDDQLFYYDTKGSETCAICMELIQEKDKIVLSCNHEFHASCMMENIVQCNNTCPLCRNVVSKQAEKRPNLTPEVSNAILTQTLNDEFNDLAEKFISDTNLNNMTQTQRGLFKIKIGYMLTIFGIELTKHIKDWIEQGNDRMVPVMEERQEDEIQIFFESYNLMSYLPRIRNNHHLSDYDRFLSADIETFMYPPGVTSQTTPYFTRDEANIMMGAIINHFALGLQEDENIY